MAEAKELDGLVAIVTGSSRNIGKAIAETLARAGAKLAINARSSEAAARDVVSGIQAQGGDAMVVMADVTD